MAGVFAGIA